MIGKTIDVSQATRALGGLLAMLTVLHIGYVDAAAQSEGDGPQEALRLFGLDQSTMRQFVDGRSLDSDEHEPLFRLLYLMPRLGSADLFRWRRPLDEAIQSLDRPAPLRGEIFRLRGWVTGLDLMELPRESAARFDYDRIYRVRMRPISGRPTSGDNVLTIFARQVPDAWLAHPGAENEVEFPAGCDAMFLKAGATDDSISEIVFAADRVAWYPNEADPSRGVSPGKSLLGQGGMDVSQFDQLDQAKPIGHNDRECFYQLLWVMGRLDDAAMRAQAKSNYDIAKLLKEPQTQAGQFYNLRGQARRAVKIQVDDEDIRQKYGIDHYYEIDVFLALPQPLSLVDPRDGESRHYDTYPVTFCVRQLPPNMPEGTSIRQEIQACGSYMKTWSYRSRFVTGSSADRRGSRRRQVSPLLIGRTVQMVAPAYQRTHWPETALVVGFVAALIVIAIAGWCYSRSDRAYVVHRRQRPDRIADDL